ncbi:MAG: hypothetical protein COZ15_02750, partial [Elusimicrobia bacterium CG_4_10_14_3_um_filter_49_12_50_7]
MSIYTEEKLKEMKLPELRETALALGVENIAKMKKHELVEAVLKAGDKEPDAPAKDSHQPGGRNSQDNNQNGAEDYPKEEKEG